MIENQLIDALVDILEAKKKKGYTVDSLIVELNQLRNGRHLDKQGDRTPGGIKKGYWNKEGSQYPKGET